MNPVVAVVAAVGSALAYAVSTVVQHRSVHKEAAGRHLDLRSLVRLAMRPVWLLGLVAAAGGLGLHVLALSEGELSVVQPLLVSGLLFALPASVLLERRRPSLAEWSWALLLVSSLGIFLIVGHPSAGHAPVDTDRLAVVVGVGILAVAVASGAALPSVRHRAALLGLAAGITYGLTAALIKEASALVRGVSAAVFSSWPLYALLVIGVVSLALTQAAYQAGPLAASLPPLTITDPIVAILIGAVVFDERLSDDGAAVVGQVIAFAAMTLATVQLARRSTVPAAPSGQ